MAGCEAEGMRLQSGWLGGRRHALGPFAYLRDLLTRIPTHPNRRIHELFPGHWKRLAEGAPATGE